jgi:predicted ATPase/Flp pilus assembly protein TadD
MTLQVQLFGEFRVRRGQEDLTPLLTHLGKPKTLLKIFLTQPGRTFSHDELIEWLWPDTPPKTAAVNLRKRISELRKALEPHLSRGPQSQFILTRPSGYCLNPHAPYTTDAQQFLRAYEKGHRLERGGKFSPAIRHYEEAAALFQGEYLAEDRYEPWAFGPARRWQERHLELLERLGECYARLGEYERALERCQLALTLKPWRESTYRRKMLYLYHSGEPAEAIKIYKDCVKALREHLDVEPSPETRALYEGILKHDVPPLPRAVPNNLPQPLTSFIGRERELKQVKWLLNTTRLLTLTGVGGCGKTRLALQVATDLLEEHPDGVWLVELAALTDPALVPQKTASALGLTEERGRSPVETLEDALRNRSLLLLLDNCEHLVGACAELAEALLRACPDVKILATSREALGVEGETLWQVPPLSTPDDGPLPPLKLLRQFEAVALFIERARSSNPEFTLTRGNAQAVVQICRQLDGLPLAIELAAARVKALSVSQIAERLQESFRLLSGGSRTALPRHQTLQGTMDWSFKLLSEAERTLLQRLSVFAGGFTLEAAEAVCTGEGVATDEVLEHLTHLVDKSLVVFEEHGGEVRYRLLEMVRQYAHEALVESGELESVSDKHLEFFLGLAERAEPELIGPNQAEWLERADREHDNLRAALAWSLKSGGEEAGLRLAYVLWQFWDVRGHLSEGRKWLDKVLAKNAGVSALRAKVLNGAGRLACHQGDYPKAHAFHEESLALYRELEDKRGIASQLNNLGIIASYQADHQAARSLYERSLAIHRQIGNKLGTANTLNNLAGVAEEEGDYPRARALYEESLGLYRELGNKGSIASSLSGLGRLAGTQGDYDAAYEFLEESLKLRRELGDKAGIAYSLSNLATVMRKRGDHRGARALYEESLAIRRELGDRRSVAYSLGGLGDLAGAEGDYERAEALLGESLRIHHENWVTGVVSPAALKRWDDQGSPLSSDHKVDHITLLDIVFFAFAAEPAKLLQLGGRAMLQQILHRGDLGLDEAPLEIAVDLPCRLAGRSALRHSPSPHLRTIYGIKRHQLQKTITRLHQLRKP